MSALAPVTDEQIVGLVHAGRRFGVSVGSLRRLVDEDRISHVDRRRHGHGESITFDLRQLAAGQPWRPPALSLPQTDVTDQAPARTAIAVTTSAKAAAEGALRAGKALDPNRDWLTFDETRRALGGRRTRLHSASAWSAGTSRRNEPTRAGGFDKRSLTAFLDTWTPTSPQKRLTTSDDRRIAELHARGLTVGKIAAEIGCSKPTVYDALKRRSGLDRPGAGRRSRRLSAEERERRRDRSRPALHQGEHEPPPGSPYASTARRPRSGAIWTHAVWRLGRQARQRKYLAPDERECVRTAGGASRRATARLT